MKVYVVSEICDYEYFCTSVIFVTDNEKIAKQYCKKHNKKFIGWEGIVRNEITYQEYEIRTTLPICG